MGTICFSEYYVHNAEAVLSAPYADEGLLPIYPDWLAFVLQQAISRDLRSISGKSFTNTAVS